MKIRPIKLWKSINPTIYIKNKDKSISFSPFKETFFSKPDENTNKISKKNNLNISTEISRLIPKKQLILNKKAISLKKSASIRNNVLYRNVFINNFKPFLLISNQEKQANRRLINKSKEKSNTSENKKINIKPESIFQKYKNYQKKFFSSTKNFNLKTYDINYLTSELNEKFDKFTSTSNSPLNNTSIKLNSRNKKIKNNNFKPIKKAPRSVSNLLKRKNLDKIPLVINSPITFVKNFKSNSEKERDEKNSKDLLKLRNILDKNWENRLNIIKEFFVVHQINDDEYYNINYLENFAHFVYDNIDNDTNMMKGIIETRIPMKEIINKGIKYKKDTMNKLKKSNSMPSVKDNNTGKIESNYLMKKMSTLTNNFSFLKEKNKILLLNENNNDKYQISEEGKNEKKEMKDKIIEFRKFLDKNYAANVINKIMGKYNEEERKNYFNKRKIGTIYISNKNNLINNINKQTEFFKLRSTGYTSEIKSIHSFSEKDINDLYTELCQVKEDFISKIDKEPKDKEKENFWIKSYEKLKKNIFEKHTENIIKEKKKLLEYIVYQNIKGRKAFLNDILK